MITLKNVVIEYSDKTENDFAIKIFNKIKKYCSVECDFNNDKYCCVDYRISERSNPTNCIYLELKTRDKKYLKNKKMIINHKKMVNIDKCGYNKCILVWDFGGTIYYCKYDSGLINYPQKIIQDQNVIEIYKTDCNRGFSNLVVDILEMLNIDSK